MDKLTNAHAKARGRVTNPPAKALKDALNMLSMSVRDAQQQGSRVEDEDIREMLANLDITPGEAASEEAMDAIRVWATVEDEEDVAEAMRGDGRRKLRHGWLERTLMLTRRKRRKRRRMMAMRARSPRGVPHPPTPNCRLTLAFWRELRRSVGIKTLHFTCRKPGCR